MKKMELTIVVPFDDEEEMETSLNRAISDLSFALRRNGLCEMELKGMIDIDKLVPIYDVTIKNKDNGKN